MSQPIRIAISGGGLAGATLIRGLLKHAHLDVHIFESAAAFKEAGAAIGVSRNALEALDLLGPSAAKCLERAGAVPMKGVSFMLAQGEDRSKLIDQTDDQDGGKRLTSIVHRAAFLHELLADVPPERMHASKQLDAVDRMDDGSLKLHFVDGTTHVCDILIGADGIRSTVRKLVLGQGDQAIAPRNSGTWAVMTLKPYAQAQVSIGKGPVDIENAREVMWIGQNTYLLHNLLNDGQLVQFIVAAYEEGAESLESWYGTVSKDKLKELYKDWPSHLYKAVDELLCDQPEQSAMYLWDQAPARTYVSGPICIIGDAAHATTPWQGSGAGMSIEDSLIISTLLGLTSKPAEAVTALGVYDEVRRPRTQRIVESSRATGEIMTGRGKETGLDLGKLREKLLPRWDFIIDFDNKNSCDEAVRILKEKL